MIIQIKTNNYKGIPLGLPVDLTIKNIGDIYNKINNILHFDKKTKYWWLQHAERSFIHQAEVIRMFLPLIYNNNNIMYADADISIHNIKIKKNKPQFAKMQSGAFTTALFYAPRGSADFFKFFIKKAPLYKVFYIEALINMAQFRQYIEPLNVDYYHKGCRVNYSRFSKS